MTNSPVKVVTVNDSTGCLAEVLQGVPGIVLSSISSSRIKTTIEEIAGESPDLIMIAICDKPNRTLLLCRELKRNPDTRDIPVVFVSKDEQAGDFEKTAFIYGCIDFLDANIPMEDMASRLSYYASVGRIERGLKGIIKRLEGCEENARCSI